MIQKISVQTYFDITPTGVKNYRKNTNMDTEEWSFQRNQQRNYETLIQCFSLRCQPLNISLPKIIVLNNDEVVWSFTFQTDVDGVFVKNGDDLALLKDDCDGVPMIVGLTETVKDLFFTPYMISTGESQNIFFKVY